MVPEQQGMPQGVTLFPTIKDVETPEQWAIASLSSRSAATCASLRCSLPSMRAIGTSPARAARPLHTCAMSGCWRAAEAVCSVAASSWLKRSFC